MNRFFKILPLFVFWALPCLWLLGVHVTDVARVFVAVFGVLLILQHFRPEFKSDNQGFINLLDRLSPALILLIVLIWVEVTCSSIARVYLGEHGKDFAIFSQTAASFARDYSYAVSVNRNKVGSFMADHTAWILAAPTAFIHLGIHPSVSVILFQNVTLALAIYAMIKLARACGLSRGVALAFTLLWMEVGNVRSLIFWGVQVEYLAIAWVILAYFFWQTKQTVPLLLAVGMALLCKESMMLWGCAFGFMMIVDYFLERRRGIREKQSILPYAFIMIFSIACFFVVVKFHEVFWQRPYDYLTRIEPSTLLDPRVLWDKFIYLQHFFWPVLFFPFWRRSNWHFLLSAGSIFGVVLISNFSYMWEFERQYVVLPATMAFIISLLCMRDRSEKDLVSPTLCALVASIAFSTGTHKPMKSLLKLRSSPILSEEALTQIPPDAKVAVTDVSVHFLINRTELYYVTEMPEGETKDFQYLVYAKSEENQIPNWFKTVTHPCIESTIWVIRCL